MSLPVNLVTFAALLAVVFLLGRHTMKGTIKIIVRGTILLALVLAVIHFFSEPGALERLFDFLQRHLPSGSLD